MPVFSKKPLDRNRAEKIARMRFNSEELSWYEAECRKNSDCDRPTRALTWDDLEPEVKHKLIDKVLNG